MKSLGMLILMTLLCVGIFMLFMGIRPTPASAAEIWCYQPQNQPQNCVVIFIAGEIKEGDDIKFKQLLESRKVVGGVVFLSGPGGNVATGINIGREIKARKLVTVVNGDQVCASICGAIWLAGRDRFAHEDARIGFHSAFLEKDGGAAVSGGGNAVIGGYYKELGLSDTAIYYLTNTPPEQMMWLNAKLATALGVTVMSNKEWYASVCARQPSQNDRVYEQVAPKLRKLPAYPPVVCVTPEWMPELCSCRKRPTS